MFLFTFFGEKLQSKRVKDSLLGLEQAGMRILVELNLQLNEHLMPQRGFPLFLLDHQNKRIQKVQLSFPQDRLTRHKVNPKAHIYNQANKVEVGMENCWAQQLDYRDSKVAYKDFRQVTLLVQLDNQGVCIQYHKVQQFFQEDREGEVLFLAQIFLFFCNGLSSLESFVHSRQFLLQLQAQQHQHRFQASEDFKGNNLEGGGYRVDSSLENCQSKDRFWDRWEEEWSCLLTT